ncbi:tigger transposable element-derived protein 1-like [Macrobrachium nipponense]|uniref:tigger transposable element-derived protein 1-like n=1 Tax=Macrobrachium nipponense TaxID=159736 RepID=UPI0030C867CB
MSKHYNCTTSTICTILKQKESLKKIKPAKGVKIISKRHTAVHEMMENLLTEKQLAGDSVTEGIICKKARSIFSDLQQQTPGTSTEEESFEASRGWFDNFKKRTGIHSIDRHGEAASADVKAAEEFMKTFAEFVEAEGYILQQIFNCDETGLFWKKMPRRTYITEEEMMMPGHKPMKDRLTLALCANASSDCKIKPLLDNNLPLGALLVLDNAPAHPPQIEEEILDEYNFVKVLYLPPNTTSILQPMDQQVISNFKKLYTKHLFRRCFEVTENTNLTLREFWKDHFNIAIGLKIIDIAWQGVTIRTLTSAWKKLWPENVAERDFEGFEIEEEEEPVEEEIVSIGKTIGLEVDERNIEELVEEHSKELMTDELKELQEQRHTEALTEATSEGEETEPEIISTKELKDILAMWERVAGFVEKNHPEKIATSRATELFNDTCLRRFRNILKGRMKQTSLDMFLKKRPSAQSEQSVAKRPRISESEESELMDRTELDKANDVCVSIWEEYVEIIGKHDEIPAGFEMVERFEFYERSKKVYAIIHTGETAAYANILLKRGVC